MTARGWQAHVFAKKGVIIRGAIQPGYEKARDRTD